MNKQNRKLTCSPQFADKLKIEAITKGFTSTTRFPKARVDTINAEDIED